jgi:phage FluMu protein Com
MSIAKREIRCAGCGSLLAKLAGGALTLQRNDLQATFDGDFHASIVCYRARCRRLNVLWVRAGSGSSGDASDPPPR